MESTPPSHRSKPKSASPSLSLDVVLPSPKNNDTQHPSPASAGSSHSPTPPILLSPPRLRRSRTRLVSDDAAEPSGAVRKRCKSKAGQKGLLSSASPMKARRSRRRSEAVEMKEEKEPNVVTGVTLKPRRRKTSGRSKKEKQSSVPFFPSHCSSSSPNVCQGNLDRIGEILNDLVMWRDPAKSTLWFGFGCLCFLSSCFTKGFNFSFFSVVSHLGLLFLGGSFLSNTLCQRDNNETRREFRVSEHDILHIARKVLPPTNLLVSKIRELFSGEPSTTLKVTPFLLIGAQYGHFITLWRLFAIGFALSFTVPKLYSCYAGLINLKVVRMQSRIAEAWGACSNKKIVAGSVFTAFWNLTSLRTRIFAVFVFMVILRYRWQNLRMNPEEEEAEVETQQPQPLLQEERTCQPEEEKALVVVVAETTESDKL